MATITRADKRGQAIDPPTAEAIQRPAAEVVDASDALFVVAAIAAVFAGGLLTVSALSRQPAAKTIASNGREVSLGDFRFGLPKLFNPRIVEFEAIAVVGGSSAAQEVYAERVKTHSARISQAVEEAGRAATDEELDDPELADFRNRIQGKVNVVLGGPVVEGVLIDDFKSMPQ
jgi:hypothetical protein